MKDQRYIPGTALVACSRLVDFSGAEITSLEIAQSLRDMGVEVKLAALEIGQAVEDEIKLLDIPYVDLSISSISEIEFDLIWVSHYVVAYHLLIKEKIHFKNGIYSSLSHFEPLETPPVPGILFSKYLVNSEENFLYFSSRYSHFKDRLCIFPNAAPLNFLDCYKKSIDDGIKSIAIVSNHQPGEVTDLIELLKNKGIEVDLIGSQGKRLRVSPEILSRYSAIITIGKTVQYCLVMGIPVFCYDYFGGPGWINISSFDLAFRSNFSGRCTPFKRTSEAIFTEIFSGFRSVLSQREALKDLAVNYFDLRKNIFNVLDAASKVPVEITLSETERQVLSRESSLFLKQRQVIGNYQQAVAERESQIACIMLAIAERDSQIDGIRQTIAERDSQIACIMQAIAERDNQIVRTQQVITEREDALASSHLEFASVLNSRSWRMTAPLRRVMTKNRLFQARFRVLMARSNFVLRQEGISGFVRRSIAFTGRYLQRKAAAKRLVRFAVNTEVRLSASNVPLVSFIIPIYDRTDLLRTAIKSALGQTLQVFEIILITDGSPPATLAVVEEFRSDPRIRIFKYPVSSGHAVRGRNKGILEARAPYIAFLDSDDVAAPDRLELCLPLLESGEADVVYGAWRALLDGSRDIDGLVHGQVVHSPDCDLTMLEKICVPCQSTVMVRRDMLLRAGFLKPCMQYREDHELWVRLAYHGARFKTVPHVLTELRLHAGNNELNFKSNDAHWVTLLGDEYRLPGPLPRKIAFLLAGLGISGGAAVVLKHVSMLMEEGHDAFVIDLGRTGDIAWFGNPAIRVYTLDELAQCEFENIDLLFATFWTTIEWLERIPARRKLYFVQSDERLFYEDEVLKAQVAATYQRSYEYLAIAPWLANMLGNEFKQSVTCIPNGLDSALFYPDEPLEPKNKRRPRVLIEGPISVPFKGMADAYAAVSDLDCELWIVSSNGRPASHWHYDRFFEGVNQAEMRQIYSSCDVLLKMSRVESFAYPPLEAMACGCAVVIGDVKGGIEYARDGENVLKVPQGDVAAARGAVQRLLSSTELRERLREAGFSTAKYWSWETSRKAMLGVVE